MDSQPLHLPVRAGGRAVVGIDIGKQHHAAVAINSHGDKIASVASFQNTREGVDLLQARVLDPAGTPPQVLFAMEATGHYWMPLYHELVRRGYQGAVRALIKESGLVPTRIAEQPDAVRDTLRRASRGRLSAATIDGLLEKAAKSIGIGYAETVINEELHASMELIDDIEEQICSLDALIAGLMENRDSPLPSLGIGPSLAAAIHAESDPASDFPSARQYAAYAGLEPTTFQSGQMTGTRAHISKRGSPHLRRALYLSAFVCYRRHEYFARIYSRFRKKGHSHNSALVVVARHLALVIWKILVENRPFTKRPPKKK